MNAYRWVLIGTVLSGGCLAGCNDTAAPASERTGVARADTTFPIVALGSGTGSTQGLRAAADFTPDAIPSETAYTPGGAFGAGIRPGRGASGISP